MSGWLSGLRVDKTIHPFSYVKTVLGTPHNPKIHHLERTYSLSLYNKVELNCCFPDGWEDKGKADQERKDKDKADQERKDKDKADQERKDKDKADQERKDKDKDKDKGSTVLSFVFTFYDRLW